MFGLWLTPSVFLPGVQPVTSAPWAAGFVDNYVEKPAVPFWQSAALTAAGQTADDVAVICSCESSTCENTASI
jgi:hypothetical protein